MSHFSFALLRLPFDQKTPIGYAISSPIEMASCALLSFVTIGGLGVLMGYFGVATACAEDVERTVRDMTESSCKSEQNDAEFKNKFTNIIIYSSQLKEFSKMFRTN